MSEDAPATETTGSAGSTDSRYMRWVGNFVIGGAAIMLVVVLAAATLARFDMIGKLQGFIPFYMAMNPARALSLIGIVALAIAFARKIGPVKRLFAGTLLALGMCLAIYTMLVIPAGKVPPIHDISTDIDDMPQFASLDVEPLSTGPFSEAEWRAFHEEAYGDIGPILIDSAPEDVLANAQALAEARGWEIAGYDVASGKLEATATAGYVRFYDDVVVEVTPVADGSTRVDMRSTSRVGVSDVGYNGARIRDFLRDLQSTP